MSSLLAQVRFVDPAPARSVPVPATAPRPLPDGTGRGRDPLERLTLAGGGRTWTLREVLDELAWSALVVVRDGALVHEAYADDVAADTRLLGASATKSALAHLVGRAVVAGELDLDAAAGVLAPELRGTGYADVPVRDLLRMTSGTDWVEDHRDPAGPASRLVSAALTGVGSVRDPATRVGRGAAPGTRWRYSSADSQVLDLVRERATGRSFAADLTRLWADLGCEHDALVLVDGDGVAFAGGGLAATARDWARLGLLQLDGRGTAPRPLLDAAWLGTTSRPALPFTRPGRLPSTISTHVGFGGHWWPLDDAGRRVAADGSRGQFVAVDAPSRTVVAWLCRWAYDDAWHDRACRDLAYLALAAVLDAGAGPTHDREDPP